MKGLKIAIIPARGGSKRITRKNIRPFLGKPIIAYSIAAALESTLFDRVIVSTDDEEIAAIARQYGAQTPFIRPAALADDHCVIADVIKHALQWFEGEGVAVDCACCIYATAPLLDKADIASGLDLLQQDNVDRVMAVTTFPFPIQRALKLDAENYFSMIQPDYALTRSQDLQEAYHDAAHFFWGTKAALLGEASNKSKAVVIPRYRVQDIDTEEDWQVAEIMCKAQLKTASDQ